MKFLRNIILKLTILPIPFLKDLLIVDPRRWHGLNYHRISRLCFMKGYRTVFFQHNNTFELQECFNKEEVNGENYKTIFFHGVPVCEVALYYICVDLKIFPSELDFDNPLHDEAVKKWYQKSAQIIQNIHFYFERYHIVRVVILQGHLPEASAARIIAHKRGVKVISFENTFNKTKLVWDDVSGITVNKNLSKNYFWKWEKIIDQQIAKQKVNDYLKGIKDSKSEEHKSPVKCLSKPKKKKSILFLGQVYTDSSVLFGINDFRNPVTIVYELAAYAQANEFELIIKLHPKEVKGKDILKRSYDLLTYQKIMSRRDLIEILRSDNIIIDSENQFDTYSLIERADVCVTINSQAGLEALIKGKDVISCGMANYSGLGFTFDAQNREALRFFLDLKLKKEVSFLDADKINNFFYIFDEIYCIEKREEDFVAKITGD